MLDAVSRIFIGAKLPQSISAALAETQMALKRKAMTDLRWVDPHEIALNLLNLGEMPVNRASVLPDLLRPALANVSSMTLKLEGLIGVPNNIQPRYVAIKIEGDVGRLVELQAAISRALIQLTGPMEGKGFEPQIVLGRLRQEGEAQRTALGRGMKLLANIYAGEFTLNHIAVVKTTAGQGVALEEISTFPLRS